MKSGSPRETAARSASLPPDAFLLLEARATHLHPGARGRFSPRRPSAGGADIGCLVIFTDGESAAASLRCARSGALVLEVASHVTARGAAIPAKRWALEVTDGETWRVRGRLPGAPGGRDPFRDGG